MVDEQRAQAYVAALRQTAPAADAAWAGHQAAQRQHLAAALSLDTVPEREAVSAATGWCRAWERVEGVHELYSGVGLSRQDAAALAGLHTSRVPGPQAVAETTTAIAETAETLREVDRTAGCRSCTASEGPADDPQKAPPGRAPAGLREVIERTVAGAPVRLGQPDGTTYLVDALESAVVERLARAFGPHHQVLAEVGRATKTAAARWANPICQLVAEAGRSGDRTALVEIAAVAVAAAAEADHG